MPQDSEGGVNRAKFLVEDFRPGYPRYSALISADRKLHICRRFAQLRTRLLLVKQDKLCLLESQLDLIDKEEISPLFIGSRRHDRNAEREKVLSEIDTALFEYGIKVFESVYTSIAIANVREDALIERNSRILNYEQASTRSVGSLRRWLDGTWCMARDETAYLYQDRDLIGLACMKDNAIDKLVSWVEDRLIWVSKTLQTVYVS